MKKPPQGGKGDANMDSKTIREALKANGINSKQVSVKNKRATYSRAFIVTIRDDKLSFRKVEDIVNKFEKVDYDAYSGEILSGGNTYITCKREWERGYAPSMPNDFKEFIEKIMAMSFDTGLKRDELCFMRKTYGIEITDEEFNRYFVDCGYGDIAHNAWNVLYERKLDNEYVKSV